MAKRKRPNKNHQANTPRKLSKREKRMKLIVYIMVAVMLGSALLTGLAQLL